MSSYSGEMWPVAYNGNDGRPAGAWDNAPDMQRSDSQSTNYTVDSSFTVSTSGYSSVTDYSVIDPALAACGDWREGPSYPDISFSEIPDVDHVLSATGSQYQQSGRQLPQTLQLPGPLVPFDTSQKGIEDAARQATLDASASIITQQPFPDGKPLFVSFEAVDEALHWHQEQGVDEPVRPAVQDVLYWQLYPQLADKEYGGADIPRILEEAAYQLQARLQGPNVLDICYLAIVTVLVQLTESLRTGHSNEAPSALTSTSTLTESHSSASQVTRRSKKGKSSSDKAKFRCDYHQCPRTFSRQADLERHYRIGHLDDDEKTKHLCDYKKCGRHTSPFLRQDHFRDHLRSYHSEDLIPRGREVGNDWWESRAPRAVFNGWWRCSRCLTRVSLEKYGFLCPGCGTACEKERQRYRRKAGHGPASA